VVDWFGLSRTHHPLTPSSAEEGSHFHGSELGRRCGFSSGAGSCRAAVALIFSPDFSPRVRGSFTGCGKTLPSWNSVRSFGVRQLAAALARASLLAGNCAPGRNFREQARREESGSKLPHSKASHAQTSCMEQGTQE
jgi:hypothetical protein